MRDVQGNLGSSRARLASRVWALAAALAVAGVTGSSAPAAAAGASDDHTVLILDSTVSGGASSLEATTAAGQGFTVEVVDDTGWGAKSTADFATYRALILGDPTCTFPDTPLAAAVANKDTWGQAVSGNVIIFGTDVTFHAGSGGAQVAQSGIAFATAQPGETGAYITLSCYYADVSPNTPVPVLDAFAPGGFTVDGSPNTLCFNDAHIVASSPALAGLTDSTISNWSCSVHEAFDTWPANFLVLAIARNLGSVFTASDGTVGTPYILARGEVTPIGLALDPIDATNPVGTDHTVTATLTSAGGAFVGETIGFEITSGPNAGASGTCAPADCKTDANGQVSFTYTDAGGSGTDSILAWEDVNPNGQPDVGEPQTTAQKTWEEVATTTTTSTTTTTTSTTTTTLPTGCGAPEPTFASIDCRLAELIGVVQASDVGKLQNDLLKLLAKARKANLQASDADAAGNTKLAKVRERQAARKMVAFGYRVRSLVGRQVIMQDVRDLLLGMAGPIQADMITLRASL